MYLDTRSSGTTGKEHTGEVSTVKCIPQSTDPYLYAEVTSINIITKEEISSFGWITTNLKQLHQVEILAMYIATHSDGGIHFEEIRL